MVRGHKYHAKPTVVDGVRFASQKEARRYAELRLLERAGEVRNLVLQPAFPLTVQGVTVATYRGDFQYDERQRVMRDDGLAFAWQPVVEDVKGMKTPVYTLKRKLMKAIHGIEIRET